ncbi:ankyrin repeat domain-containing protein [Roseovarius sp. SYSU LYC5161]|uniref:ankyrin repeat domain-containing protein n=1 Tax=Roseovarius halophilus (ex Wu et al. 2025) TaxID=3376060 RepID=UPI003999F0B9
MTKTFQSTHTADEIRACLQSGHAVNARDDAGNTALHLAAAHAPSAAVTRVLLRAGADPDLKNAANRTPMHMAAAHSSDPAQIATLAIWGAEVNKGSIEDECWSGQCMTTPLHLAVRRPGAVDVVAALLAAGATADIYAGEDLADISDDLTEDRYLLPLHLAARHAGVDSVVTLLQAGAEANAADNGRRARSALHYASVRKGGALDLVQALLDAGASADAADFEDTTPLILAASHATDPEVFARLLDAAEEPFAENERGLTAKIAFDANPALERDDAYWALHAVCNE